VRESPSALRGTQAALVDDEGLDAKKHWRESLGVILRSHAYLRSRAIAQRENGG
jgi:hypothetical protein